MDDNNYKIKEVCESIWGKFLKNRYHCCIEHGRKTHVFRFRQFKYMTVDFCLKRWGLPLSIGRVPWRSGSIEWDIQFLCWSIHFNDYGVLTRYSSWPKDWWF